MQINLVSFPRSGSALAQVILWQCFGVTTWVAAQSRNPNLGVSPFFGHLTERLGDWQIYAAAAAKRGLPAIAKTHDFADPAMQLPALVIIRDGRAAYASFAQFRSQVAGIPTTIPQAVAHRHWNWSAHVEGWLDYSGPKLVLTFEELRQPSDALLQTIGTFLCLPRTGDFTATIEDMRVVRPNHVGQGDTRTGAEAAERAAGEEFWARHGSAMDRMGYRR